MIFCTPANANAGGVSSQSRSQGASFGFALLDGEVEFDAPVELFFLRGLGTERGEFTLELRVLVQCGATGGGGFGGS